MAEFTPRLTRPEAGNKYYITRSKGGYSDAIPGKPEDSACNVLSNCVGYAFGRFNEIVGAGSCRYLRPVNAELFIQYAGGLPVGQTPRLGACMVWRKGPTLSNADGAGHVAIVEQIISPTQIVTSESGWGSKPFWTQNRSKGSGNWGQGAGYTFLGFIYNPAVVDTSESEKSPTDSASVPSTQAADISGLRVGDIVYFTGINHYPSASAASGPVCRPGRARVTAIYPAGKHPVHLVRVSDGGSTVYGWVDASDIKAEQGSTSQEKKPEVSADPSYVPAVGDIVEFTGDSHYTNSMANMPKRCTPGKARITACAPGTAHPYHLVRVIGEGSTVYGWVNSGTFARAK